MLSSKTIRLRSYTDKALIKAEKSYSDFNKNYSLSIQISLDGFSFSILDEDRNKYVAFELYSIQEVDDYEDLAKLLGDLFDQLDIIKRRFNKINVIFEGSKSSLVPFPLFDEIEIEHYLKFGHALVYDEEACYDKLPNLQAYNVYALAKPIKELIKARFINYKICHTQSSLIEGLLIRYKNQDISNKVFVNVRLGYLDVLYIKDSKLEFSNTFKYKTNEDFAYFLINVLEELQLNPESIEMTLLGEIDKSSSIYEVLYKYIRNIDFIERNDFYSYSYAMDELPAHFFYNLLNVGSCEL
jgi:hypothetical protein